MQKPTEKSLKDAVGFQYETACVFTSFLECPPAFILSNTSGRCDCIPKLAHHQTECYIDIIKPSFAFQQHA